MTYKVQIDDLVRDATPEEIAAIETHTVEAATQKQIAADAATARASALAKLETLGLTAAEIAALVG